MRPIRNRVWGALTSLKLTVTSERGIITVGALADWADSVITCS